MEGHALFEEHQCSLGVSSLRCYVHQCATILKTNVLKSYVKYLVSISHVLVLCGYYSNKLLTLIEQNSQYEFSRISM